ncbi:MAG TPA: CDP-glycerol glycerophosphotransferase family protein [Gammaproteobacteria bacterium]|nr:CDP-glycerol glycerophosphotransferase family protein [Gammaproteobacteria bacterium]
MTTGSRKAIADCLLALASRALAMPLTWLVPRDPRRWLVIGREHGRFLDNAKYFFIWMQQNTADEVTVSFLSERRRAVRDLRAAGARAVSYPGLRAFFALLRSQTVVVDTVDPIEHGRLGFLRGARLVQLWHGAPLKQVERPLYLRQLAATGALARSLLRLYKRIIRRYRPSDVLVSTSTYFTERAFGPCFAARRIVATGYPRNDIVLSGEGYSPALVNINVDQRAADTLARHRAGGGRVVLYAPTFRADMRSPFENGTISLARWSAHAKAHGYVLLLKLHPSMQARSLLAALPSVIALAPESDVYPMLRDTDAMVTDYSSIFFDYLLLDRPIVFFVYDRKRYASEDHGFLFDYDEMTPGPKVESADELFAAIERNLGTAPDSWADARRRVVALAFDHRDGQASRRLWQALREER